MKAIFFPKNTLNVGVCDIFNDHKAIITQNTDRLKDGKFELAEIELFKNNLQGTSFLNPYAAPYSEFPYNNFENSNYGETLTKLKNTGRISFGLYHRTDSWKNPNTGDIEYIPSYYKTTWEQDAIDAGFDVVLGASKTARFPNHGQQLYDISNGAYGYDFVNNTSGTSGMSESNQLIQAFKSYFKNIAGLNISALSYENGRAEGANELIPYMLGGRNSSFSGSGNSLIDYSTGLTRAQLINRANSTRTWDAQNNGTFPSKTESIDYSKGEIQKAIDGGGWYNDFMHWHSLYDFDDLTFFAEYFDAIRAQIGTQDTWNTGQGEAIEYYFIRESLKKVGSYEYDGKLKLAFQIKDKYLNTDTNGIPNESDISLFNTPISFKLDTTGTALAGKEIKCDRAKSIRKLSANIFVINVPYNFDDNGYSSFEVEETTTPNYFNNSEPVITHTYGKITTDIPCKIVQWRKSQVNGDETIVEVERVNEYVNSYTFNQYSGYTYYIGAITEYGHSSLVKINQ